MLETDPSLARRALWPFRLAVLSLLVFGVAMVVIQVARANLSDRAISQGIAPQKELSLIQRHASRALLLAAQADEQQVSGSCQQVGPPTVCEFVQLLGNIEAAASRLLDGHGGASGLPASAPLNERMTADMRWIVARASAAGQAVNPGVERDPPQWLELQETLQAVLNRAVLAEQDILAQVQADRLMTRRLDVATMVTVGSLLCLSVYLMFWMWARVVNAFRALRRSQARLKAYASAVPDIAYVVDQDGIVIEQLGNTLNAFPSRVPVGQAIAEHRSAEVAQTSLATIRRAIESGQVQSMEAMVEDPQGQSHWFEARIAKIDLPPDRESNTPSVPQVILLARDVSARKQAEIALRQSNEQLETRVAERTHALKQAVDELRRFNYTVSHDLRGPLRAVEAYLTMAMEEACGDLSQGVQDMLERARRSAKELSSMVESLRNLSRIADMPIQASLIDLSALARELCEAYEIDRGHKLLQCSVQPGMSVWADEHLVRSLLQNLIGNAVKYSAGRQPARVEVGSLRKAGVTVFFVRDNGAGFDMAKATQLFQPFSRLHSSREFAGDGIGLATVRRIVQRHGGRIWAHARANEGATFLFTLPGQPGDVPDGDFSRPMPLEPMIEGR